MSIVKKLAGQTALYGLSSMLGRALTFLLFPFYAAVLLPAEFGIMTELYSHVALLNIIYLLGMETAYFRFSNREGAMEQDIFNNAESLLLAASILFSGTIILLSTPIASALDYPGKENYVIWLAIVLATDAIVAIPFARLRLQNKAAAFAGVKMINIILNIFLNVFFLYFCKGIHHGEFLPGLLPVVAYIYSPNHDVAYVFLANLIANLVLIPIFWKSLTSFKIQFNAVKFKPLLVYAYPLVFMGLAGMVNESFSRIILRRVLPENFYPGHSNETALGIFGACYRLSVIMNLAIQSFRYAAEPFFFSQAPSKNAPETFSKIMKWFIIICLAIYLGVSLNLEAIGKLTLKNPVYREGLVVVPYLLLANLFLGIYYNLSVWFKLTDKTHYGTFISIIGAVVTIVLNFILIPHLGYMGSAITSLVCYFLMCIISYLLGQKRYPIQYQLGNAVFYILLAVFLTVINRFIAVKGSIMQFAFATFLILVYAGTVFVFEKKDLNFKPKPL